MKLSEFIKNTLIPLVSVVTALLVGVLNFQVSQNDAELRERDQQLQERLGEIDAMVTRSREQREERESNQEFNLKIYDIVIKSLEENDAKKQEAAKAFVVVMGDDDLRDALLRVFEQGGQPPVQQSARQILEAEERFRRPKQETVKKTREETRSYPWGNWDFDIFWCSESGTEARKQAGLIGEQLVAEGAEGKIRVRELPASINARSGYRISDYEIRRNSNEEETADALKALADKVLAGNGIRNTFEIGTTRQDTAWYISAFVCPTSG